jgi:endonuclease YncB( thermonuclease family)
MAFKVIKGTFHLVGYSPDGDSVRFMASDQSKWASLSGSKVKLNPKAHAQLRIEGIDTLETHYEQQHQSKESADQTANQLFKLLGIKNVVWNPSRSKVVSADDGVDGYIISRLAEKYGRPVSFVFAGPQDFVDGQEIFLNKAIARKSVNFKLLSKGLAYPTFYDGMFYDLRELFAKEAAKARAAQLGVWSKDMTNKYFRVESLQDITETHVIMPKLFRRLIAYIKKNGNFNPTNFVASLSAEPEKVLILSILHFTHFDNLISVNEDGQIRLEYQPENLVFLG